MSEQGDDETTPKKKRKTSTTSTSITSIKKYFSDEARMSKEKASVFSDILMDNSTIESWDDEKLYKKYNINKEEQLFIESLVKKMI